MTSSTITETQVSVDLYSEENFPEEFESGVVDMTSFQGESFLYSSKEFDKVTLQNQSLAPKQKQMWIRINRCDQNKLKEGQTCASNEEIDNYVQQGRTFTFLAIQNFIDYKQFDELPIERISKTILELELEKQEYKIR